MKWRAVREAPELQAARKLLAAATRGVPTLHAPINRVLTGLGLEVSRQETPAEKVARVKAAVARHDSLMRVNQASDRVRWADRVAKACLAGIRRCFARRR